jgi:DNA-binding IclR family transcriptional regulator
MADAARGAIDKTLSLLSELLGDGGGAGLPRAAERLGLPLSTAHRMVGTLERHGFLTRAGRGRYVAGPELLQLAAPSRATDALVAVGRPILAGLARKTRRMAHLGVLEGDMVTYLLKAASGSADLFTREGMQLEAYCSGIGKVLLAGLPGEEQDRYLTAGPFVSLTERTIVDPDALRSALVEASERDYAIDDGEIDADLCCIAVPVRDGMGQVTAAISVSSRRGPGDGDFDPLPLLAPMREAAADLERKVFGVRRGDSLGPSPRSPEPRAGSNPD